MADLRMDIRGDGSEAAGAMREVAGAAGELDGATGKLGESTKQAGSNAKMSAADWAALGIAIGGVVGFAKDSIAAFAEQERADKQLEMVAGNLAEAFKAQASQMQKTLGVSDDMVQRMQTLALRFDTVPSSVEPATMAILDWSAATGKDAEGGMTALVRAVEFGQGKIKSLGIEFEATGNKTKDLNLAVAALAAKFGGSAATMGDTLSGRTSKLTEAFGELREVIGGMFGDIDRRTGLLDSFAAKLAAITDTLQGMGNVIGGRDVLSGTKYDKGAAPVPAAVSSGQGSLFGGISLQSDMSPLGQLALGGASGSRNDELNELGEQRSKESTRLRANELASTIAANDAARHEELRRVADVEESNDALAAEAVRRSAQVEVENDKRLMAKLKADEREEDAAEKAHKRKADAAVAASKDLQRRMEAENKKFEQSMMEAGLAVGMAFATALADAIAEANQGGEVDAIGVALDLAFATSAIVGGALVDYYAPGAGRAAAGLTMIAGQLAHDERAKTFKREQASKNPYSKRHGGGWIGDMPRYHGGRGDGLASDEEVAILQRGEVVWSRQQVANSGGPKAVDRMRKGGSGGGFNITINAQDSKGVREFFEGQGGRGIENAIRTGRGDLSRLFGGA